MKPIMTQSQIEWLTYAVHCYGLWRESLGQEKAIIELASEEQKKGMKEEMELTREYVEIAEKRVMDAIADVISSVMRGV